MEHDMMYPGFKWSWKCAHFYNRLLQVLSPPWILQSQTLSWHGTREICVRGMLQCKNNRNAV